MLPYSRNQDVPALQECTFRKVWEDDGNVQRVEVEQSATAFFKTIYTRMHVVQVTLGTCYSPAALTMLTQDPQLQPTGSSARSLLQRWQPGLDHCKCIEATCQSRLSHHRIQLKCLRRAAQCAHHFQDTELSGVAERAPSSIMCLSGASCLQDRSAGTMHFSLAKPGMLKHFEGQWTVSAVEGEKRPGAQEMASAPNHLQEQVVLTVWPYDILKMLRCKEEPVPMRPFNAA